MTADQRRDDAGGMVSVVAHGLRGPNGVIFSSDESTLYVCDSRANEVWTYEVAGDGRSLGDRRLIATSDTGSFDNIRLDDQRRLWVAAGDDGVHCYAPDGTLIGRIRVPELVANLTFGGAKTQPNVHRRQHHAVLACDDRHRSSPQQLAVGEKCDGNVWVSCRHRFCDGPAPDAGG